jgi:hypothetical protein
MYSEDGGEVPKELAPDIEPASEGDEQRIERRLCDQEVENSLGKTKNFSKDIQRLLRVTSKGQI